MKSRAKKHLKSAAFAIVLLILSSGCAPTKKAKVEKKPNNPAARISAHQVSKAQEQQIKKDALEDLKILMKVRKSLTPLKKALSGNAYKSFSDKVKKDLAGGKITVRKYSDIKLTFHSYTKGIAGIMVDFTDNSYFVDSGTGRRLEATRNTPKHISLALKKLGGRWKIIDILGPGKDPGKTK